MAEEPERRKKMPSGGFGVDRSEFIDKDQYFSDISLTNPEIFVPNLSLKYNFLLKILRIEPFGSVLYDLTFNPQML